MRWYDKKYELGAFRKGIVIDDDFHGERCNILLNYNMWFRVKEIKMEQGLQQYMINHMKSQVQSW